ncbi:sodium:solute symporter family transporter [Bariatricus sp. SGI.154]|uniref:sodium:solute symporter family transporter n=1 Tax=Bariatricus sp. SGI.154 TaxID=3420549 RepID=UPI003D065732
MGPWVTALSAQASDMSAWLLMGLPGSILAFGFGQMWIGIGLALGTAANWNIQMLPPEQLHSVHSVAESSTQACRKSLLVLAGDLDTLVCLTFW